MTPEALARLHAACFAVPRPWTAEEIASVLGSPGAALIALPGGFAIGRAAAGEAELLTLAVDPARRRRGIGAALLARFEARADALGAAEAVLEVAERNRAARALYAASAWREVGRRPGYYADGQDALVLRKALGAEGLRREGGLDPSARARP